MINIPLTIQLPNLWGTKTFTKNDWGPINLIVGPNGTGKSLLAEQLKISLMGQSYKVRLLNAERLSGLEKKNYDYFGLSSLDYGLNITNFSVLKTFGEDYGLSSSAFVILKERLDIRIKIEALISDIFNKTIRLVEEGGFLKPKIQNNIGGTEYGLKENECHGLKEIITLLTFLYDDSISCLILDEPELHLHPQFQSFFLSEIRKMSGDPKSDPSKKLFFIITHSPYFLDLRSIEDLKNILICHYNLPPNYVDTLADPQDEYILKKFLPRFNTHHKQFFFSPNPVFVEGYTDQQIITLLFDKLDLNIHASGSCVIDVGGKDELAVFYRLCKHLNIQAHIVADLDAVFKGKLREVAQDDPVCNKFIQDNGLGTDLSNLIGELDRKLKDVADELVTKTSTDADVKHLIDFLKPIISTADKRGTVVTSCLIALVKFKDKISAEVSPAKQANINYIVPRFSHLLNAFKAVNIFIFPKGEIEHYYTQTMLDYLNFSDKDKNTSFHTERDYILTIPNKTTLISQYPDLISILEDAVPQIKIDLMRHLQFQLIEWIQTVQRGVAKGDFSDIDGLKINSKVDYTLFNQIVEVTELNVKPDKKFVCKIKISKGLSDTNKEITFDEQTIAHDFVLTD